MTWFRIDDAFADHPKVLALRSGKHGKGAVALWALAGVWCSRHLTDGRVPSSALAMLGGTAGEASALVSAGLWETVDGGYQFHDWTACNPLRTEVESKREANKKRVTGHREKRTCNALQAEPAAELVTLPPSRPVPSRPDPTEDERETLSLDGGDGPTEEQRVAFGLPGAGPTPGGIVQAAYETALGVAHAKYAQRSGDARHFKEAAAAMKAAHPERSLRETAVEWCAAYVTERHTRSPEWLSQWSAKRLAAGPVAGRSGYAEPSAHHEDMTDADFMAQFQGVTPDALEKLNNPKGV